MTKNKKPSDIDWGRMGDPEYLASVTGGKVFEGKVATDEEVCESFGVEEGKRISTKRLIINRGGWVGMNKFGENTIVTPKGEDKIELVGNLKDKEIVLD